MTVEVRVKYTAELTPAAMASLIEAARSDDPSGVLDFFATEEEVVVLTPEQAAAREMASQMPRIFAGMDLASKVPLVKDESDRVFFDPKLWLQATVVPGQMPDFSKLVDFQISGDKIESDQAAENVVPFKANARPGKKPILWNFVGPDGEKATKTITELADQLGVSYAAIYAIARGKNLTARGWRCVGKAVA